MAELTAPRVTSFSVATAWSSLVSVGYVNRFLFNTSSPVQVRQVQEPIRTLRNHNHLSKYSWSSHA